MLLHSVSCETHASKYSLHRNRGRPSLPRTCSSRNSISSSNRKQSLPNDEVSIPPSMKSVISQVGDATYVQRKKRLLDDPLQSGSNSNNTNVPLGVPKIFHLHDLDMETEFQPDEIELSPPLYERPKNTQSQNNSYIGAREDTCELEYWPDSASTSSNSSVVLPDRRPRQPGLNPHFLKLYAAETTCKIQQTLPCVNIDESLLKQLSYHDLRQINVSTPHASGEAIRLALATRKKLWTEMIKPQRQDLYGESIPQNQRFVLTHSPQQGRQGSLLRIDSDVKPWTFHENSTMLRPCGTLKMGRGKPDVQYVVKGWCDSRFS
ncbi:hypothetical protein ZYGR_0N02820 [Zygosaccharomyces rouxii]|uniref:ZYRO0D06820p n=2 Tax=Zygosaccharomyces rouxii TaxID=4956 RepID=C5DVH7_ZYGRC|nr:uncharacterized protein ZYRO0D06820g [Zygosaccharomyces rouxii]KAH9200709.1 hypothetical protein LQ764DRAFT_233951 [Zygosaccharomyces rouxii]GAV48877.1 hypothetical protein ZYGR_0N02820 [Zygosaccharomyces rouxii]CAR27796.1 ZYRO0D06820p [Zygosaccharomyces rouxii]